MFPNAYRIYFTLTRKSTLDTSHEISVHLLQTYLTVIQNLRQQTLPRCPLQTPPSFTEFQPKLSEEISHLYPVFYVIIYTRHT